MKAITVWQPWAQLLAEGKKHDETRSWRTNYRGEILIHAAKSDHSGILLHIPMNELKYFQEAGITSRIDKLQTGAIIGAAILTDCKLIDQTYHDFIKEFCPEEFLYGDFTVGRYAWRFEKPQLFKTPIPVSGKQGLWNFGENVQIRNGELYIKEAAHGRENGRID